MRAKPIDLFSSRTPTATPPILRPSLAHRPPQLHFNSTWGGRLNPFLFSEGPSHSPGNTPPTLGVRGRSPESPPGPAIIRAGLYVPRGGLAGHILRASDDDPLRQVSYQPQSAKIYDVGKRRIGGPRQQWLFHTNKYIWEDVITQGMSTYEHTDQQNNRIIDLATNRLI